MCHVGSLDLWLATAPMLEVTLQSPSLHTHTLRDRSSGPPCQPREPRQMERGMDAARRVGSALSPVAMDSEPGLGCRPHTLVWVTLAKQKAGIPLPSVAMHVPMQPRS